MDQKYLRAISSALWDTNMVSTRLLMAAAEFIWAAMLFWPGDTFGRPTYNGMAALMGEVAWATVLLCSSVAQTSILLTQDFHGKFARYFAAWNAALWVYVVGSMLASVYPPPAAIGGEIAIMLAAVWIWARPFLLAEGIRNARAAG